jgi:hypothetical protein
MQFSQFSVPKRRDGLPFRQQRSATRRDIAQVSRNRKTPGFGRGLGMDTPYPLLAVVKTNELVTDIRGGAIMPFTNQS